MMNEQGIEAGKLAPVGELAAGIAHEINNPMAIMVEEAGWIEDLLQEEEFQEGANLDEFKRAVKQIKIQGKRCKEITHKLLSFARKTDPKIKVVQLNDLVEEIVALCEQRAKYSNIHIHMNLMPDLPTLHASPSAVGKGTGLGLSICYGIIHKIGGEISVNSAVGMGAVFHIRVPLPKIDGETGTPRSWVVTRKGGERSGKESCPWQWPSSCWWTMRF